MSKQTEGWQRRYDGLLKATREHPDDGWAWLEFADFLFDECDNPDLVVRAYEKAREWLPERDLRLRLGRAYVWNYEREKGIAMIGASATERPRVEAYCFLAQAHLFDEGHQAEAEEAARKAIEIEPSFEEAHYVLGESLRDRDHAGAIKAYRTAVSLDPDYASAWQRLGSELARSDDTLVEAVVALEHAIALDPEDGWAMIFLAHAHCRMHRLTEADEWYRKAIDAFPDYDQFKVWYQQFKDDVENATHPGADV